MAISSAQEIYQEVHRSTIVYDAACGLTRRESTIDDCVRGGLTVVAPTVGRGRRKLYRDFARYRNVE